MTRLFFDFFLLHYLGVAGYICFDGVWLKKRMKMFEQLLSDLDLQSNRYYTKYELLEDKLIIKSAVSVSDILLFSEVIKISEQIDRDIFDFFHDGNVIEITFNAVYQTITEKVKELISQSEVILPSYYNKLFADVAAEHNVTLSSREECGTSIS